MAQILKGTDLILYDDRKAKAEAHLQGKVVAFFFSASWCPA
jgi:hypothetical protein